MRLTLSYLTLIALAFCGAGPALWAQDDLFAGTPSPSPSFLSDHSYDNSDVDGTTLEPKDKAEEDDQNASDDEDSHFHKKSKHTKVKAKHKKSEDEDSDSDSREPDSNGL